jgi:predicted RNA polymerase sigma factor
MFFNDSPVVKINRAYVLSKVEGPAAAIRFLQSLENTQSNLFYNMMLGELYKQACQPQLSKQHFLQAKALIPAGKIKDVIDNKLRELSQ